MSHMTPDQAREHQAWHAEYRNGTRSADLLDQALETIAAMTTEYRVEYRFKHLEEWTEENFIYRDKDTAERQAKFLREEWGWEARIQVCHVSPAWEGHRHD